MYVCTMVTCCQIKYPTVLRSLLSYISYSTHQPNNIIYIYIYIIFLDLLYELSAKIIQYTELEDMEYNSKYYCDGVVLYAKVISLLYAASED